MEKSNHESKYLSQKIYESSLSKVSIIQTLHAGIKYANVISCHFAETKASIQEVIDKNKSSFLQLPHYSKLEWRLDCVLASRAKLDQVSRIQLNSNRFVTASCVIIASFIHGSQSCYLEHPIRMFYFKIAQLRYAKILYVIVSRIRKIIMLTNRIAGYFCNHLDPYLV